MRSWFWGWRWRPLRFRRAQRRGGPRDPKKRSRFTCTRSGTEIVDSTGEFGAFAKELGGQPKMTAKEYAALAHEKITEIFKTVQELGKITAVPHC